MKSTRSTLRVDVGDEISTLAPRASSAEIVSLAGLAGNDVADHGRPIAELGRPDFEARLGERQGVRAASLGLHDLVVRHQRAEAHAIAVNGDLVKAGYATKVDEHLGAVMLPTIELDQ